MGRDTRPEATTLCILLRKAIIVGDKCGGRKESRKEIKRRCPQPVRQDRRYKRKDQRGELNCVFDSNDVARCRSRRICDCAGVTKIFISSWLPVMVPSQCPAEISPENGSDWCAFPAVRKEPRGDTSDKPRLRCGEIFGGQARGIVVDDLHRSRLRFNPSFSHHFPLCCCLVHFPSMTTCAHGLAYDAGAKI